jgi:hypothetical protein
MAMRKPKPPAGPGHDWYLQQWMKTLRVRQAQLGERCGWGKSKTNDVYHGRTIYTRDIVNEVADALNLHPWAASRSLKTCTNWAMSHAVPR